LHFLRSRHLFTLHGLDRVHFLRRGQIFDFHRRHRRNRLHQLCYRHLFGRRRSHLLQLCRRHLPRYSRLDDLHELRRRYLYICGWRKCVRLLLCGHIPSCYRLDLMYVM